jgi:hypothetical protein
VERTKHFFETNMNLNVATFWNVAAGGRRRSRCGITKRIKMNKGRMKEYYGDDNEDEEKYG